MSLAKKQPTKLFSHFFKALGTEITIDIVSSQKFEKKIKGEIFQEIEKFVKKQEEIFSRFNEKSELSRLNNDLGKTVLVSDDMFNLAQKVLFFYEKSEGICDPRIIGVLENIGYQKSFKKNSFDSLVANSEINFQIPLKNDLIIGNRELLFRCRMDFSGLAKGYLADRLTDFLRKQGFDDFIVDLGGDLYVSGQRNKKRKWFIGIEGVIEDKVVLSLKDRGVATSGTSRRNWEIKNQKFHHLINPKNPSDFSFEIVSVSVIAESVIEADFLAKVIFLKGIREGKKYIKREKIAAFMLLSDNKVWISEEGKNYLI